MHVLCKFTASKCYHYEESMKSRENEHETIETREKFQFSGSLRPNQENSNNMRSNQEDEKKLTKHRFTLNHAANDSNLHRLHGIKYANLLFFVRGMYIFIRSQKSLATFQSHSMVSYLNCITNSYHFFDTTVK